MTAMFDTLKFARALRDGGSFTPEQAERLSDALSEAISGEVAARADLEVTESKLGRKIDDLRAELVAATARLDRKIDDVRAELKQDIADLRAELKQDITDLRAELKQDITDLRAELKQDITDLRTEIMGMEAKFEAAKADTIKWVVGIVGFQTVAIVGAAVVLARILGR